jgi:hypothetical protein
MIDVPKFSTKTPYSESLSHDHRHSEKPVESNQERYTRLFLSSTDKEDARFFYRAIKKYSIAIPTHPLFSLESLQRQSNQANISEPVADLFTINSALIAEFKEWFSSYDYNLYHLLFWCRKYSVAYHGNAIAPYILLRDALGIDFKKYRVIYSGWIKKGSIRNQEQLKTFIERIAI